MDAFSKIVQYVQEHGQAPSTPEEMEQVMGGVSTSRITEAPFPFNRKNKDIFEEDEV